ncbi:MAG: 3-isopropylmalate dehydratase small subunit [Candidatus Altiarchaeota archaeon]|nr:3-isopropylmalate dehydratase small subunit [Candidatus Altiarchaeota archaeon]
MKDRIKGRVWRFGKNVDTDQIIPAEYLVTGDAKELARHAFEKVRPEFARKVRQGDIIVADENFGCGSSREHAPRALIGAGITCVIARSFARIFYRNSINIGLPLVESDIDAKDFDEMEIDFTKGQVTNLSSGKGSSFPSYPPFVMNLINSGGLVEYVKKSLGKKV